MHFMFAFVKHFLAIILGIFKNFLEFYDLYRQNVLSLTVILYKCIYNN